MLPAWYAMKVDKDKEKVNGLQQMEMNVLEKMMNNCDCDLLILLRQKGRWNLHCAEQFTIFIVTFVFIDQ